MKTNANTILPIFVVVVVCCCVFLSLSFLSSAILFVSGAEMRTKNHKRNEMYEWKILFKFMHGTNVGTASPLSAAVF